MGVLDRVVRHLERLRRPQLTIVLAGHAYFDVAGRIMTLGPGDVVTTDQSSHEGEGYGGRECEVITIDCDPRGLFVGGRPESSPSSISMHDVQALRTLVGARGSMRPREWTAHLAGRLRALGLPVARAAAGDIEPAPAQLARLYAALGPALSRLDTQPTLSEIAMSISTSERNVNRMLTHLARAYDHPFAGWRELVHEMRLVWATQLLSLPDMRLDRVARLAGYRSTIAFHHALSIRGGPTPRTIARRLAERWHGE